MRSAPRTRSRGAPAQVGAVARRGVEQRLVRGKWPHVRCALASLAALETTEGFRVTAEVLGLFRERMIEVELGVLARRRGELTLDLCDLLGFAERRLRDLGERGPCAMVLRIDLERSAIRLRGAREIADELLRRAEVVVVLRLARVERDRAPERIERLGVRARVREHDADRVERERAGGPSASARCADSNASRGRCSAIRQRAR